MILFQIWKAAFKDKAKSEVVVKYMKHTTQENNSTNIKSKNENKSGTSQSTKSLKTHNLVFLSPTGKSLSHLTCC